MVTDYESLLSEAKTMYAMGHDNTYIELQLADKGIDDTTIDKISVEIKHLRKSGQRNNGMKQIIYGLSFIAVGFVFTLLSFLKDSPVHYVLWGLAVSGLLFFVKGLSKFLL
ncbi:MAG: hypothetical protein JWP12_3063 [Bacteroidetes bacterium]|nr:hypothetical protein [Bacteroidota bacterium]